MGDFRYGGGNGKNFDFRVYGMAFGRAAEFHPDHVNFDEWQMGQGGFRTDWQLNTRDTLHSPGRHVQGLRRRTRSSLTLFATIRGDVQ